jgi:hypothetical protein
LSQETILKPSLHRPSQKDSPLICVPFWPFSVPFNKILFELEALNSWKRARYLGHKINRQGVRWGHTGNTVPIQTDPTLYLPQFMTTNAEGGNREGKHSPGRRINFTRDTWEHNPSGDQFPLPFQMRDLEAKGQENNTLSFPHPHFK